MPISNLSWRNTCGVFFWTFSNFMCKRAKLASGRCKPVSLLWPMNFTRTVVLSLLFILVCVGTDAGTTSDYCSHASAACAFQKLTFNPSVMFLLLCGDVETNPGPGFPLDPELSYPRVSQVEQCLQQLCASQSAVENSLCSLDTLCRSLKEENRQLKEEVSCLSDKCSVYEHHFSQLFQWQEYLSDMTEHLHDHQDKLETFSRQYNIRFFNIQKDPREDYRTCARKVIQPLTRFYPVKTWTLDDVERAHRVGPRNEDGRPRTIIARLRNWCDKLSVLQEGESRRDMADTLGIRVAGDLTIRQQRTTPSAVPGQDRVLQKRSSLFPGAEISTQQSIKRTWGPARQPAPV